MVQVVVLLPSKLLWEAVQLPQPSWHRRKSHRYCSVMLPALFAAVLDILRMAVTSFIYTSIHFDINLGPSNKLRSCETVPLGKARCLPVQHFPTSNLERSAQDIDLPSG